MNFRLTGVAFATVLLVGCASAPDKDPQGRSDPLEGFNRTMFDFNLQRHGSPYPAPGRGGTARLRADAGA